MTDQSDVFSGTTSAPAENTTSAPTDYADLLGGILNEQGKPKYDSIPKALEGLANAQQYIPELKSTLSQKDQEIAALKAELEKRAAVEDVVTRLTANQSQTQGQGQPPATSGLDQEAVLNLVRQQLEQSNVEAQAKTNYAQVQQALSQKFGEKARDVIQQKANELGTSPQELGRLASQNPKMVLALFNAEAKPSVKPTTGSVNIPPYSTQPLELERPTRSLLSGATSKEQAEYMRKIKEHIYAKHNVQVM